MGFYSAFKGLIMALDGFKWSVSHFSHFTLQGNSQYPLNRWMGGHEGKKKILRSWELNMFILMHYVGEECKLILRNVPEGGCGLMYTPRPSPSILIPTAKLHQRMIWLCFENGTVKW
jgi:hypothetical protein